MLKKLFDLILNVPDMVFPNLCVGCLENTAVKGQDHFCTTCHSKLPFTNDHDKIDNALMYHFYGRVPIERAMALLWYSDDSVVQNMIHNLKYKRAKEVGIQLGKMLGDRLFKSEIYKGVDMLIPVPMHRNKQLIRGYNQTEIIADAVTEEINIPTVPHLLAKKKETESQTSKTRQERVDNAMNVFYVTNEEKVKGKHIMLIDDVVTTGSTLESCALVLLKAGAAKISIGCLAMGNRYF